MNDLLTNIEFWHWWALAALFLVIEVLVPSTYFLWMSIAAGVTGLAILGFPDMSWEPQLFMFSVLSVVSIVLSQKYLKRHPIETDEATLNRRGEQHIGKIYTLTTAIENGTGKVKVGDSFWRAEGPDMAEGTKVRVTAVDGNSLVVEAAE